MAFDISYIFQAIDKFSPVLSKIDSSLSSFRSKIKSANESIRNVSESTERLGRTLSLRLSAPLVAGSVYALKQAADFQTLAVQMQPYLGSLDKANKFTEKLKDFTATTPIRFKEMQAAASDLMSYKTQVKDVIPLLGKLSDIHAQTGMTMETLARLYGVVNDYGKIQYQQIRQMPQIIPVLKQIAKEAGMTKVNILDMSAKGQLSFAMYLKALDIMTSKGGIAYKANERFVNTLGGSYERLMDNVEMTSAVFGRLLDKTWGVSSGMKSLSEWLIKVRKGFDGFAKAHPMLTKIAGILDLIGIAFGPILIGAAQFGFAITGITALLGALVNPWVLLIAAIIAATAAAGLLDNKFKKIREAAYDIWLVIKPIVWAIKEMVKAYDMLMKPVGRLGAFADKFALFGPVGTAAITSPAITQNRLTNAAAAVTSPKSSAKSESKVTIEMKDPGKTIKSVKTKPGRDANINVGQNMGHLEIGWVKV